MFIESRENRDILPRAETVMTHGTKALTLASRSLLTLEKNVYSQGGGRTGSSLKKGFPLAYLGTEGRGINVDLGLQDPGNLLRKCP